MIREATPDDFDALVALLIEQNSHNHAIAPDRVALTFEVLTRDELKDILADESCFLVVHETDNVMVGLLLASHQQKVGRRWLPERNRVYIEELVVTQVYRRQGIAEALLEAALDWAQQREASQIDLHVWSANDLAVEFYRNKGFEPHQYLLSTEVA